MFICEPSLMFLLLCWKTKFLLCLYWSTTDRKDLTQTLLIALLWYRKRMKFQVFMKILPFWVFECTYTMNVGLLEHVATITHTQEEQKITVLRSFAIAFYNPMVKQLFWTRSFKPI